MSNSQLPTDALKGTSITPVFAHKLPNVPGKSVVGLTVDYLPGASTPPHRHGSAFVTAYVISGAIRSQVNDEEVRVYKAGESWSENPGAFHKISENASDTEPAKFIATFIVESDYKELLTFDCPACEVARDTLAKA